MRVLLFTCIALCLHQPAHAGAVADAWEKVKNFPKDAANVVGHFRFDEFTKAMAALNAIQQKQWTNPKAKDVPRPVAQTENVPSMSPDLAEFIVVPKDDEGWEETSDLLAFIQSSIAKVLPFPSAADKCGKWDEGEDQASTVKKLLLGGLNSIRTLVPWGDEKYTDEGFSNLVFSGIGQHRVEKVRANDMHKENAVYAVYLNFAEQFQVKEGFAKYGADAYFNEKGEVTHIRRGGQTYYPTGEQGWEKHTKTDITSKKECESAYLNGDWKGCFGLFWPFRKSCKCDVPAKSGWKAAKIGFLGTFSSVMNAVDHVYFLHFVVSNSIATANVEELAPTHPLRRLMNPFGFRSATMNFASAFAMASEAGLLHRSSSLSEEGLKDLFEYSQKNEGGKMWQTIPEAFTAQGIDDSITLPLHEDGAEFYGVLKGFVKSYLSKHYDYSSNECGKDEGVQKWYGRVNTMTPREGGAKELTCENLEDLLATMMYYVTAQHNHVGTVGAEFEDPCHLPWAWREGELCAPPRTAYTQMVILALRCIEQPLLMGDYTHLFDDQAEKDIWNQFQDDLKTFQAGLTYRNAQRVRPFKTFDLNHVEISVSQ